MYKSRKYLTSGGKEYVSDGIKGQHSPFASKLLEALRSNGGEDGILTMTEVYNYMEKTSPTPHYGTFGDDEPGSDFLFISMETEIQFEVNTEVVPQRNNLIQVYNKSIIIRLLHQLKPSKQKIHLIKWLMSPHHHL